MKKTVLIVDDSAEINRLLATILTQAGFHAVSAYDGREAMERFQESAPDLLLLDLSLPDMDGSDVCRQVRARSKVPIIMVTGRNEDMDKVIGLEIGADDYVTKPFNKHELLARVRALLRRAEEWGKVAVSTASPERVRLGGITLGPAERRAWVGEAEVGLTHTEFDLLQLLMDNPGIVVTREQLLERIWGIKSLDLDTRTVDNHVARLRKKLAPHLRGESPIETVPTLGYRFRAE